MNISVESPVQREWNPTKKQQLFISVPFSVFEGLYGGAAGSGKSEILLLLPLIYNFHQHPLFKGLILRRTYPELESEIILRSKEWYSPAGGTYNESKRRWTWPRGAVIQFGHAEREEDVRKYDTAQYNYVGWDESTSFTQFQYEYLSFSRVRSRSSDLPAIVRAATNPGNVGHTYFRSRFVDPWKAGGKLLKDSKTGLRRIFIQALITDNPHILKDNPQYVQQLESLPEAEKRAKLLGDWYTFSGQVFKEFRLEPLPDEPDNAKHVVEPFDIPHWWPRVVGIDWGYTAMTWIGWAAISPEGKVYIYKEYAETEKKTIEWINDFINASEEDKNVIEKIRICHSADQKRGEYLTILGQLQSALRNNGFSATVELADRNRIGGKLLLHEYLRWQQKPYVGALPDEPFNPELAERIMRVHGLKAYRQYVSAYEPEAPETNLPKLQILSTCPKLIDVIPSCVYDDVKTEDVKEFTGDDPYDGVRILLGGVRDYMYENAKKIHELKETEDAMAKLQASGNQTSFYRRMEFLEAKHKSGGTLRRRRFSRYR